MYSGLSRVALLRVRVRSRVEDGHVRRERLRMYKLMEGRRRVEQVQRKEALQTAPISRLTHLEILRKSM